MDRARPSEPPARRSATPRSPWRPRLGPSGWLGLASVAVLAIATLTLWGAPVTRTMGIWAFGVPALIVATLLMRKLGFGWGPTLIVVLSLVLYVAYFGYTSYGDRNYDGPEQLRYLRHIAQKGSLPKASACFVCHHPPLYYLLGAGCYRLAELSRLLDPVRGVQVLGLAVIFSFLIYAVLLLRRFITRRGSMLLATGLVALWPYSVLNSVRVHNDVLVCVFMLAGVYHLVRWHQGDGRRQLWWASAFALAGLLTKSSGYILVATIVLVALGQLYLARPRLPQLRRMALPLLLLVTAAGGYALRPRASGDEMGQSVLGSAYNIHPRDYTGNEPRNFLYFDVDSFVNEPYLLARSDGSGRQYYWNHLLKSSLFATHNNVADAETAYRYNRRIAELLNVLLLAMVVLGLASLALAKRDRWGRYTVVLVASASFFAVHIAFKALVPSGHHNDFRFVYPVLVFGALGYTKALESYDERRLLLGTVGRWMAAILLAGSVVYFLPKYAWVARHLPPEVYRPGEKRLNRPKKEGVPWDQGGHMVIALDEVVEVSLGRGRTVKHVDVLVDHNDRYELVLITAKGDAKRLVLGPRQRELELAKAKTEAKPAAGGETALTAKTMRPRPDKTKAPKAFKGMARYRRAVDPPIKKVTAFRIRALSGDHCYAIGHVIVK
jgi:hypothetical protein